MTNPLNFQTLGSLMKQPARGASQESRAQDAESGIVSRHRQVDGMLRAKNPRVLRGVMRHEERCVREGQRRDAVHEQPGQDEQSQVKMNSPVDV